MICPNCRCVVPGRMTYCGYCGYEFSSGAAKTLTVEESCDDRFYRQSDYCNDYNYPLNPAYDTPSRRYGYSRDLAYDGGFRRYGCSRNLAYERFYDGYGYAEQPYQAEKQALSTEAELALVAGIGSVFLLVFIAILIILL